MVQPIRIDSVAAYKDNLNMNDSVKCDPVNFLLSVMHNGWDY